MSSNGLDTTPLAGWSIVLLGGNTYIGRLHGQHMSPVFALNVSVAVGPKGVSITFVATPVLMLASVATLEMPAGGIEISCDTLSRDERKRLHHAVQTAEENSQRMRAAEAGVLLANTMPRPR